MGLEIRKFVNYSELVHIEGFKKADKPLHIFAVAAVITILGLVNILMI